MLAEMLVRISERLLAGGSERVAAAGADPAAQLRALIDFQVDFALDNPALITVQDRDLGSLPERRGRAGPPAAAPLRRGVGDRARAAAPGRRRRHLPGPRARRLRADQLHPAQRRAARPRRRWPRCSPTWPGRRRRAALTRSSGLSARGRAGPRAQAVVGHLVDVGGAAAGVSVHPGASRRSSPSSRRRRWRTPRRDSSGRAAGVAHALAQQVADVAAAVAVGQRLELARRGRVGHAARGSPRRRPASPPISAE